MQRPVGHDQRAYSTGTLRYPAERGYLCHWQLTVKKSDSKDVYVFMSKML